MGPTKTPSRPGAPGRSLLIVAAAAAALFLILLGGLYVWLIMRLTSAPEQVSIAPAAVAPMPPAPMASANPQPPVQQPLAASGDLRGRILAADRTPVAGATVFVSLPGRSDIRIRNETVDFADSNAARAVSSADGDYDLPPQSGTFQLQALGDAGYGQADQDAVKKNPDVQLTAWGRVEGRMLIGTKPAAGVDLQAYSIDQMLAAGPAQTSMVNRARTDADGNFTMERVLPGTSQFEQTFLQHSGSNAMGFSGLVGRAQVAAGQTTTITLGGVGRPVVGKFVFPPGLVRSDYFINARAIALADSAATVRQLLQVHAYFLNVDADHNFRIDNVPPGGYRIHVFLQKVHGDRASQPNQMRFTMPAIPGGVSDDPLVIPDIQLQ
jgi:hypothetical protein